MSASDKKKLRKEQTAAATTEKQRTEQKQQKKLKAYTLTFIIAMVLVVAIFLGTVLSTPVVTLLKKSTTSLTINDHKIDAVELNYFYIDAISDFVNQFSDYGDYASMYMQMSTGLNPAKALDSQVFNSTTGETWADYFTDAAIANAKWFYALYDDAMANGFTLSKEDQAYLDQAEDYLDLYAAFAGAPNAKTYLRSIYGPNASIKSYLAYNELTTVAQAYAAEYVNGLEFTDEDFREHEKDKYGEYSSYSWLSYYVKVNDYLEGGTTTKDENGKETTTYSDEEKAAALAAAKADAEALLASNAATKEELNAAINALEINKPEEDDEDSDETKVEAAEYTNVLYSNITLNEDGVKWLTDSERENGNLTYIENTTGTDENKTTVGFYVLLWTGKNDNLMSIGTVRHLLVEWEIDKDKKEPSQEQKDAAKAEAEKLLNTFREGDQSEEAFIALLKTNSDDKDATTGAVNNEGLYSGITPDSGYVQAFKDWATADHEKGDVEIIETEYGYHIMYYVEAAELNYRDTMINNVMINDAYNTWQEGLLEKATVTEGNLKYVDTDYVIAAN